MLSSFVSKTDPVGEIIVLTNTDYLKRQKMLNAETK